MKGKFFLLFMGGLLILLSSCHTSNVVSDRLIQKRKYTSGWFLKKQSNKGAQDYTVVIFLFVSLIVTIVWIAGEGGFTYKMG